MGRQAQREQDKAAEQGRGRAGVLRDSCVLAWENLVIRVGAPHAKGF